MNPRFELRYLCENKKTHQPFSPLDVIGAPKPMVEYVEKTLQFRTVYTENAEKVTEWQNVLEVFKEKPKEDNFLGVNNLDFING